MGYVMEITHEIAVAVVIFAQPKIDEALPISHICRGSKKSKGYARIL
jgi:hypothetical protein